MLTSKQPNENSKTVTAKFSFISIFLASLVSEKYQDLMNVKVTKYLMNEPYLNSADTETLHFWLIVATSIDIQPASIPT